MWKWLVVVLALSLSGCSVALEPRAPSVATQWGSDSDGALPPPIVRRTKEGRAIPAPVPAAPRAPEPTPVRADEPLEPPPRPAPVAEAVPTRPAPTPVIRPRRRARYAVRRCCLPSEPGTLTTQGPSGMFLNPTSGILRRNAWTAQLCVASLKLRQPDGDLGTTSVFGWFLAYGATDWLEVGVIGTYVDNSGEDPHIGPSLRARVVRECDGLPEISVGFYSIEGDPFERRTAFFALSKRFHTGSRFLRGVRLHAGGRNTWTNDFDDSDFVAYGGLELALPADMYLIGEVSTKNAGDRDTPWAAGVQFRSKNLALSVGAIQPGASEDVAIFIGVGARDG